MTTIVFKDGVLAGDSRVSHGNMRENRYVKIGKNYFIDYAGKTRPFLFGVAGHASFMSIADVWMKYNGWKILPKYFDITVQKMLEVDDTQKVTDILNANAPDDHFDIEFIVALSRKELYVYTPENGGFTAVFPPYACGSGNQVAIGALESGASAVDAVKIAAKHDIYTGGQIRTVTFD